MAALRAAMAGEDAKELERLSRFQDPAAIWKAYRNAESKLSERQTTGLALPPDDATPEQISEWRKSIGMAEVGADAPPQVYMDAYRISAPDGYEMSEMEKATLGDFAKRAYEAGAMPRDVKLATDYFFESQQQQRAMMDQIATQRQREWQGQMRDEMGSREYDAQTDAATRWLKAQFEGDPDSYVEITRAQLPGGGHLGDHPFFVKLVAEAAMKDGYTDQIQANSLEAGGKSIAEQIREIEGWRSSDRSRYDEAHNSGRLDKLYAAAQTRGYLDSNLRATKLGQKNGFRY